MPRDVNLRHSLRRDAIHVIEGIKTMILRGNVNIVHIQQNPAVRLLDYFVQEFPLSHFRNVKLRVTAHIFDRHRNFQIVAHLAHFLRRQLRRFKRVRHGQQIVRISTVHAAPTKMIRKPRRLRPLDQFLQSPQMFAVRFLRGAEVHRNAVLHHLVLLQYLVQNPQRPSAIDHEILGNNLEPVAHGLARQNMIVVRRAQSNPNPVLREPVKSICRHSRGLQRSKHKRGPAILTSPPTGENHSFEVLAKRVAFLPASCCRRLRSRPCPCKSSCLCNHCRSPCSRPCLCRSFGLYRRAFLSPSCQTSSLCPERKRKHSPRGPDWKPGCWHWCPRASPRPPHPLVGTDLTLSFSPTTS